MAETVADRIRQVLKARGWTQHRLGEESGFRTSSQLGNTLRRLDRTPDAVEQKTLRAIARGARVRYEWLATGIGPRDLAPGEVEEDPPADLLRATGDAPADHLGEATSALEEGLRWAFDPERHTIGDLNAVQRVLRTSHQLQKRGIDWREAARVWLDCAAQLRREGEAVTWDALLVRLTVGQKPSADQLARAAAQDADAAREQRAAAAAKGIEWGSKRAAVERLAPRKPRGE